jgi:hypothetical protein
MRADTLRNVAVVLALAAFAAFVPAGGRTGELAGRVLSALLTVVVLLVAVRLYQGHRMELLGLGDLHRAILYGSIGLAVLAMAARERLFDTALGTFAWFVMIGAALEGLYVCWRRHRRYLL